MSKKDKTNNIPEAAKSEHTQNIYDLQIEYIKSDIHDIKSTLKTMDARIDNNYRELNTKIDNIDTKLSAKIDNNFKWMLGMFISALGTVGAGFSLLLTYMWHLSDKFDALTQIVLKLHG